MGYKYSKKNLAIARDKKAQRDQERAERNAAVNLDRARAIAANTIIAVTSKLIPEKTAEEEREESSRIAKRALSHSTVGLKPGVSEKQFRQKVDEAKEEVSRILSRYYSEDNISGSDENKDRMHVEQVDTNLQDITQEFIDKLILSSRSLESSPVGRMAERLKSDKKSNDMAVESMGVLLGSRYFSLFRAKNLCLLDEYYQNGTKNDIFDNIFEDDDSSDVKAEKYQVMRGIIASAPIRFFENMGIYESQSDEKAIRWSDVMNALYYPIITPDMITTYVRDNMTKTYDERQCYESIGERCCLSFDSSKAILPAYYVDSRFLARAYVKRDSLCQQYEGDDFDKHSNYQAIIGNALMKKLRAENPGQDDEFIDQEYDRLISDAIAKKSRVESLYGAQQRHSETSITGTKPNTQDDN